MDKNTTDIYSGKKEGLTETFDIFKQKCTFVLSLVKV